MADPVMGYDDEELVAVVVDERNWKGIGISLLVIVTIFSFIGLAIFILTPKESEEDWGRFRINLTDLIGPHLKPNYINGSWLTGNELIYQDPEGSILLYDATENVTIQTLIPSSKISQHNVHNFKLSSDRKYLFLEVDRNEVNSSDYVHYQVYNISSKKIIPLKEIIEPYIQSNQLIIQCATWSTTGNAYVFVVNNDIYYCQGIEEKPIQISNTGSELSIYNGIPDWFYKEFMGLNNAVWWSRDGKMLIYATFNDTQVELSPIKIYGKLYEDSQQFGDSEASVIYQRYPKAGRPIPIVTLWVVKLADPAGSRRQIIEPSELSGKDKYLTYVDWTHDNQIIVIWSLRSQNYSILCYCSLADNWFCQRSNVISNSINKVKYLTDQVITTDNPSKHFIITPKPDLKIGQYHHIVRFNLKDKYPNLIGNFLTHGRFDVKKLLAYDPVDDIIYFQGTGVDKPAQSHIYLLNLANQSSNGEPHCITCYLDINSNYNVNKKCGYYEAIFSPTTEYYLLRCLGPRKVFTEIRSSINHSQVIWTIDDNKEFEEALMDKRMPTEMYLNLPIDNDSRRLNIKILVPPPRRHLELLKDEEEEEETIRYPLIIESFPMVDLAVSEKFDLHWGHYLSSSKEYVYAQLELREINPKSSSRDVRWSKVNYDHQLAVIDLLDSLLGNIDRSKVALWGNSGSAFTALETIAQDKSNLIACSIGLSPIVNWRLMDTISSEFLFGNPNAHQYNSNYDMNNLLLKTDEIADKKFLIAHGTADEVVHIQHTMLLTKSLIKEATSGTINYHIQIYPDDDHSLSQSKLHFYILIETYLTKCFAAVPIPTEES